MNDEVKRDGIACMWNRWSSFIFVLGTKKKRLLRISLGEKEKKKCLDNNGFICSLCLSLSLLYEFNHMPSTNVPQGIIP